MRRTWMFAIIALAGGTAIRAIGAERWSRLVRNLDRRSGLTTTWGTGLYGRVAPRLFAGLYARVADDVASVRHEGTVLDVGTGPGLLVIEIARRAPRLEVVGVDPSPDMLAAARLTVAAAGLTGRVRFERGEAAALPFADGSFDLAVSTLSLHHWERVPDALRELHRVLRPGGRLWLYDVRFAAYSVRELRALAVGTPFADQDVQRAPVRTGRLPVATVVRFALNRRPGQPDSR